MRGFGFFASVTGVFCYSGLVSGFFATVGVGGFLRQCWGGFLRQWKGFWLRQGFFFCIRGEKGFGFFASVTVFFCYSGFVRGFFATVGVGGFLRQCWGVFFCDNGRVFGYGKGGFLHLWWFSATVTKVYYIGAGSQRSGASRRHLRGRQ